MDPGGRAERLQRRNGPAPDRAEYVRRRRLFVIKSRRMYVRAEWALIASSRVAPQELLLLSLQVIVEAGVFLYPFLGSPV